MRLLSCGIRVRLSKIHGTSGVFSTSISIKLIFSSSLVFVFVFVYIYIYIYSEGTAFQNPLRIEGRGRGGFKGVQLGQHCLQVTISHNIPIKIER